MSLLSRGYYFECDRCGEQFDPEGGDEVTDTEDVFQQAKKAGWVFREDEDLCPDCRKE